MKNLDVRLFFMFWLGSVCEKLNIMLDGILSWVLVSLIAFYIYYINKIIKQRRY